MIEDFAGKTAVLTGAGSGFGLECARIAAQRGMRLVLVDVQQDALDAAAAELAAGGAQVNVFVNGEVPTSGLGANIDPDGKSMPVSSMSSPSASTTSTAMATGAPTSTIRLVPDGSRLNTGGPLDTAALPVWITTLSKYQVLKEELKRKRTPTLVTKSGAELSGKAWAAPTVLTAKLPSRFQL